MEKGPNLPTSFNGVKTRAGSGHNPSLSQAKLVRNLNVRFPQIYHNFCPIKNFVPCTHYRVLHPTQTEVNVYSVSYKAITMATHRCVYMCTCKCTWWPLVGSKVVVRGMLWWGFLPNLFMDLGLKRSSLFVLLMGTVLSGHSPALCQTWVIVFASFLVYVESLSGLKLGLIYVHKLCISDSKLSCFNNTGTEKWNQTWMVWFLSKGWSKAGWLVIGTQSITSPSSLCKKNLD